MRLHFLITQTFLLYLSDFVLAAPVATTARNSDSETGGAIVGGIFAFGALVLLCAWLGGAIKCNDVKQIVL